MEPTQTSPVMLGFVFLNNSAVAIYDNLKIMLFSLFPQSNFTPLMLAASNGNYQGVETLLKWSADTTYQGHVSHKGCLLNNIRNYIDSSYTWVHIHHIAVML